ncbi:MAG TPA: O-antigen ligase family protein, partial [Gaiellales bacterium]
AFGIALALPGITNDGEPRSTRVHDGWIFALVLLGGAALVFAAARVLGGLEARRPLAPERRRRLERAAGLAALALALIGVALSIAFAGRIWHEFTNPVSSQIGSTKNRLGSASSSNRWRWWGEEWHAFTAHPFGGTGAGTFKVIDLRMRKSPITTDEPHSTPLQFLGELGVVGFLLYVAAAVAAAGAIVRARRRAAGAERAAVTALAIGVAAFAAHTAVDMDWNFVATCGPLLLVTGALAGRAAPSPRTAVARRPLLAAAGVVFALGAFYSLAAPWLAQRELDSATSALGRSDLPDAIAHAKRAHSWDPLSTSALLDWAAFEDDAPLKAQDLYRKAVSLEPQSSEVWFALGDFYWGHGAWKPAYDAYSKAWQYDRFGPAGTPCGALDQARHKVLRVWPPSCPRGRPRASTP